MSRYLISVELHKLSQLAVQNTQYGQDTELIKDRGLVDENEHIGFLSPER